MRGRAYLALVEAEDRAVSGSELRIRLHDCATLIGGELAPDLGELS